MLPTVQSEVEQHPVSEGKDTYQLHDGTLHAAQIANDAQSTTSQEPVNGQDRPDSGKKAWLALFGCFCTYFAAMANTMTLGTYQAWLSQNQLKHHDPSTIGWIFGFFNFFSFFAAVQIGAWFDRFGPKAISAMGTILLILSYTMLGFCHQYWQFFVVLGLVGGLATSLLFTAATGVVSHWFEHRRGFAMGITVSGGSLAGIIFPLVLERLFPTIGFAWATRAEALMIAPFALAGCFIMRSRLAPERSGRRFVLPDFSVLRDPRLAVLTAGVFCMDLALFIPSTYITSYALANGIDQALAYRLLTLLNTGSLFGRWIPGHFADKIGRFTMIIATFALCAVSVLGIWLPAGSSAGRMVAFALIYGFASGSNVSLVPVCLGQLCSTRKFGRTLGACSTITSFAALLGIPLGGKLLVASGGQYWTLVVFAGLTYVGALMCFVTVTLLERYRRKTRMSE